MCAMKRLTREELAPDMAAMYDECLREAGDARLIEVGANAPELLDWYFNSFYKRVFYEGRVDVRTKELLRLKLSKTHGCFLWNRVNTVSARRAGLTTEQIDALPDDIDNEVFSPRDRAVLKLCEQMVLTNLHGYMTEEMHHELAAHFSDGEIFELGVTMAVLSGFAKFLFCFDLADREKTCPIHRPAEEMTSSL